MDQADEGASGERGEKVTRTGLRIVARCKKCGRGFITIGTARPARDPYYPNGTWPTKKNPDVKVCNGEIDYFDQPDRT